LVIFQITKISNSGGHWDFAGWDFFGVWTFGFWNFLEKSPSLRSLDDKDTVGAGQRSGGPLGTRHDRAVEGNGHAFAPGQTEFVQQRKQRGRRGQRARLVVDVDDGGFSRGAHFLSAST
jgi:hypothetical protein